MEDKDIEKILKDEEVSVPESLSPENIKEKLDDIVAKEQVTDKDAVKEGSSNNEPKAINKEKGKVLPFKARKYLYSFAMAASLLLVFGLGYMIRGNMLTNERKDNTGSGTETNNDTNEEKPTEGDLAVSGIIDGYKISYKALERAKKYYDHERKYIVYEDAVNEAAADSSGSSLKGSIGQLAPSVTPNFTDTNERTEGVHEDDVIKTDGKYIYVYNAYKEKIEIYSAKDGKTELMSRLSLISLDTYDSNIYVSGDRLITIGYRDKEGYDDHRIKYETVAMIYNIKDRKNPELLESVVQDGYYRESRLVDGHLYVFSNYYVDTDEMDEEEPETYIPEADGSLIPKDDIYVVENALCSCYTIVNAVNIEDGSVTDKKAYLGGADLCYVSTENIYLIDSYYNYTSYTMVDKSGIVKVSYKDGYLKTEATGSFIGSVKDHYSLDEQDGYLRLCATYYNEGNKNAVYILNSNLEKVGTVKNIAKNETIKSVRFMGNTCYLVTFRRTDPLFAIDVSDPENPEMIGYIKLPGFSDYLHPYNDHLLLGVGFSADEDTGRTSCVKISMFDISDPRDIKEVATKELLDHERAGVNDNTKNFMFDPETGLFGTSFYSARYWEDSYDEAASYEIYKYDEKNGFVLKLATKLGENMTEGFDNSAYTSSECTRGMIIGKYIYVVTAGEGIKTFDKTTFAEVQK